MQIRRPYPVEDGDITEAGRRQQIAVAAWVLGWLSGPLPAIIAIVVRPGAGTYRRLLIAAAWFWTAIALVGTLLIVVAIRRSSMWPMVPWFGLMIVALVATALAVRLALRRIGPDPNRPNR